MKNLHSLFRSKKNIFLNNKMCIFLMVILIIFMCLLTYVKVSKIYTNKEGYKTRLSYGALRSPKSNARVNTGRVIGSALSTALVLASPDSLDSVLDAISEKKEIPPQWRDFYGDGEMEINNDIYTEVPDTTNIINDTCSTKGFLYSDYKDDFCDKYNTRPEIINKMCKKMSISNCKIPSCCVLLDGKKCVAGNTNGPLYLTEDGKDVDYVFYTNKNKCYGNCNISDDELNECNKYKHNSIDISKKCMVQMFNRFGCSNPSPDYFINDKLVKEMSLSSKSYVENSIKEEVSKIVEKRYNLDNIIKCKGQPFVINKYREFNTLIPTTMKDEEVLSILKTKNEIDLSDIFLNYYR